MFCLICFGGLFADSDPIELPPMPEPHIIHYADQSIIQKYQILDRRFCHLTPDQFLCERCIDNDMAFVRLLRFDTAGRPSRFYGCMAWRNPYLN